MFPLKDENPTEKHPIITISLIIINVAVFIYTFVYGNAEQIINQYAMVPKQIVAMEELYTILTSMFLHGNIIHIVSNMWFLWIFGDNIEDLYGKSQFLLIYFGSGVLASIAHTLFNPTSLMPTIGASGAVAGILGAYIVKYPRANVITLLFFILVKIPSFVFIGVWILSQVVSASITSITKMPVEIAYWAHIGGFVAGMIMAFLLEERISRNREI